MALSDDDVRRIIGILRDQHRQSCLLADPEENEKHVKHHNYIDIVMQREAERTMIRRAVIEKSLAGLVWSGMVAFGAAIFSYVKDHLK